jgi:hypothetical protein
MAVTDFANGTQTATVTTEHQLADVNAAGVYTFSVDTNAMADGDVLELRVYEMALTSGTARVLFMQPYYGAQPTDDLIKASVPVANALTDSTALRFSLKQTFGTGRSFPWRVNKIA